MAGIVFLMKVLNLVVDSVKLVFAVEVFLMLVLVLLVLSLCHLYKGLTLFRQFLDDTACRHNIASEVQQVEKVKHLLAKTCEEVDQ
jgi:hypothetical protein